MRKDTVTGKCLALSQQQYSGRTLDAGRRNVVEILAKAPSLSHFLSIARPIQLARRAKTSIVMSLPSKSLLGLLSWTTVVVLGNNDDLFNYGAKFLDEGGRNSFPQPEWDAVTCDDIDVCVSARIMPVLSIIKNCTTNNKYRFVISTDRLPRKVSICLLFDRR
jgi:hypothetical protein